MDWLVAGFGKTLEEHKLVPRPPANNVVVADPAKGRGRGKGKLALPAKGVGKGSPGD